MYRCVRKISIASMLFLLASSGGVEAAAAQPVTAAGRSLVGAATATTGGSGAQFLGDHIAKARPSGKSDPPACVPDSQFACLLGGRFQVLTTYFTDSSTGFGNVMSFAGSRAENDQSAFFWFFNDTNFEMGIKMVDACSFNNQFWVYIGGLTDQGWKVKITDTQNGAVRTYSNDLGHLSTPVGDTSAFPCP